jgi:peptidoglycan hydrolase CwlO-like protein
MSFSRTPGLFLSTAFLQVFSAVFSACFLLVLFFPFPTHAQTAAASGTDACSDTTGFLTGETTAARQARLTKDSADCAAEVAAAQAQLDTAQDQSASIQKDINVLTAQINAAQLKIKQENLVIQTLGQNITQKQSNINSLEDQITQGHETLSQILTKINENGDVTIPNLILSTGNLSEAMSNFDDFEAIQNALSVTFTQLRANETENQNEKDQLTTQQNQEEDAKAVIQEQQATVQAAQKQKQQLLAVSKENESSYSDLVAQKQEKANEIKAALFNLAGTSAISFGDALSYANTVYAKTGVPQAFLLAILTQETGIGKNVGTCYLTNPGDGSGINSKNGTVVSNVMKPSRDVQPFLAITSSLGLDYKSMPVSCPQSIGYGGGMGPAQFIASTWTLLASRIKTALGISTPANPWRPLDAFTASALYLSDLGADSSSYTAQKNAACKYYSGKACGYVTGATSYGNSVMALATSIQNNQIDPLEGL